MFRLIGPSPSWISISNFQFRMPVAHVKTGKRKPRKLEGSWSFPLDFDPEIRVFHDTIPGSSWRIGFSWDSKLRVMRVEGNTQKGYIIGYMIQYETTINKTCLGLAPTLVSFADYHSSRNPRIKSLVPVLDTLSQYLSQLCQYVSGHEYWSKTPSLMIAIDSSPMKN